MITRYERRNHLNRYRMGKRDVKRLLCHKCKYNSFVKFNTLTKVNLLNLITYKIYDLNNHRNGIIKKPCMCKMLWKSNKEQSRLCFPTNIAFQGMLGLQNAIPLASLWYITFHGVCEWSREMLVLWKWSKEQWRLSFHTSIASQGSNRLQDAILFSRQCSFAFQEVV